MHGHSPGLAVERECYTDLWLLRLFGLSLWCFSLLVSFSLLSLLCLPMSGPISPIPQLNLLSSALLSSGFCWLSQLDILHYCVSSTLHSPVQLSLQALHSLPSTGCGSLFLSPCPECMSMPGKARGRRGRPLVTQRLVPSRAKPLCLGEAGVSLQSGLAPGFVV